MAETPTVGGFLTDEWTRFWQGYAKLTPEEQFKEEQRRAKLRARTGQQNTVSLPGWNDVIHLEPRLVPTTAQKDEYYAARRQHRDANLPPEVIDAIESRRAAAGRIASSTAPGYAQAFGQMLTAIDNVQDFTTTVATLGRLALWPAISTLDAALPRFAAEGWARTVFGATPQAAENIARLAANQAASDAYLAARAATLSEYATAARLGLERSSLLTAGREAAELAAAAAWRATFREVGIKAAAGIGSRVLGRLIPGLGWILLIGDLLNLLTWLGMSSMIGYAAACFGIPRGLAAAAPVVAMRGIPSVGPCGVKGHVAKLGDLNPFSRVSRGRRALRVGQGAPGLGAILETLQTTDQAFGVGISFGAIVGAFTEGAYAAELQSRGESVSVKLPQGTLGTVGVATGLAALQLRSRLLGGVAAAGLLLDVVGRTATAPLKAKHQAAQQLQNAVPLAGTQETFTELEHIEQMVNYYHALDLVGSDLHGVPWQDFLAAQLPLPMSPPRYLDDLTVAIIRERDPELRTLGRWPMPGAPEVVSSTELIEWGRTTIPRAMRDFLEPRRDSAVGMFAGGMYNLLTDQVFTMLEDDPTWLQHQLTPEWRLLYALGETNRLPNVAVDPDALWGWWLDSVNLSEQKALQEIDGASLDKIADAHGVTLIRLEQPYLRLPLQ